MTRTTRAAWLTGTVLGAALAAALLLHGGEAPSPLPEGEIEVPARPADPTLVGRALPATKNVVSVGRIEGRVRHGALGIAATVELRYLRPTPRPQPVRVAKPGWLYEDLVGEAGPLARTRSASDGTFVFAEVVPGRYEVRARGPDGTRASRSVVVAGPGTTTRVRLDLPTGEPLLRGVAVYADGRPFRGFLRVHHRRGYRYEGDAFGERLTYGLGLFPTGDDGSFVVRGVPAGHVRLAAFLPGRVRYPSPWLVLPHDGTYRFVVDDGYVDIRGRVLAADDGTPVPGALVEAFGARDGRERVGQRLRTDASGSFRVRLPPKGVSFAVEAAGFEPAALGRRGWGPLEFGTWDAQVTSVGPPEGVAFELPPSRRIQIRLLRAAKVGGVVLSAKPREPVAHVPVFAMAIRQRNRPACASTTSDATGRFTLDDVPLGRVFIFAAGAGWVSRDLAEMGPHGGHVASMLRLSAGAESESVLEVIPAGALEGRVLGPRGESVSGCMVACLPSTDRRSGFPLSYYGAPGWTTPVATDADGRFRFDTCLPDCPYRLVVRSDVAPPKTTTTLRARSGETTWIEIHLDPAHWILAEVTAASTGDALAGVEVTATAEGLHHTGITGADGRALLGPVPGSPVHVRARRVGYTSPSRASEVTGSPDPEHPTRCPLSLLPVAVVSGRVVAPPGIPPTAVSVFPSVGGTHYGRVDENGRFLIPYAPPGEVTLRGHLWWEGVSASTKMTVTSPTADAVVDLREAWARATAEREPVRTWRVFVLDAEGRPVPHAYARIRLTVPGHERRSMRRAVEDGRATLTVRARAWDKERAWLEVWDPRDATGRGLDGCRTAVFDVPPGGDDVEVALPAGASIVGRVVTEGGEPVPGLRITARSARFLDPDERWFELLYGVSDPTPWEGRVVTVTDAEGRYRLDGLADGSYVVHPSLPLEWLPITLPTLRPGEAPFTFTLRRGIAPRITVHDPSGNPLPEASVRVRHKLENPHASAWWGGLTNAAGSLRLGGLDPDRDYVLAVSCPDDLHDELLSRVIHVWRPEDQVITLEQAFTISGRMILPAAGRSSSARVHYLLLDPREDQEDTPQAVGVGKDGSFRIDRLRRDQTVLAIAAEAWRLSEDAWAGARRLTAGQTEVVLPIEDTR